MQTQDNPGHTGRPVLTAGVSLLIGLIFLLVAVAPATEAVRLIHLSLAYLFLVILALYRYLTQDGSAGRFALQVTLAIVVAGLAAALLYGGLGNRSSELAAVFVLMLLFVLARDDLPNVPAVPYLLAFAALFGVFLYHAVQYAASSGLGLFPVFAGIILGLNLFVVPRYVSQDAAYWSIGLVAAAVALLALPTVFVGDYAVGILEVRTWPGTLPVADLSVSRSIYANPNTFGLLMFPGVVASLAATHRSYTRSHRPAFAVVPVLCLSLSAVGLVLSNSRAALLATVIGCGLYAAIVRTGPKGIPIFMLGTAVAVGLFLLGIALGVLPIDPANRFTLWRAGLHAVLSEGSPLGQGLVGSSEVIEPYLPTGTGTYSIHNSYLSIALRTGFVGGLAYIVLVIGPLLHSIGRPDRAARTIGMLTIASGFAVHQLFEAYTLYQFGPGSILGALAVGYVIESLTERPPPDSNTNYERTDPSERADEPHGSNEPNDQSDEESDPHPEETRDASSKQPD